MQGLAFTDDGQLWASEFGQSTFDELNRIELGGNYGWPEVEGEGGTGQGFIDPQAVWGTDVASPSGLAFSSRMAASTSPERMVVFAQGASVSVVDATYLGAVFKASVMGLSGFFIAPQYPAKSS